MKKLVFTLVVLIGFHLPPSVANEALFLQRQTQSLTLPDRGPFRETETRWRFSLNGSWEYQVAGEDTSKQVTVPSVYLIEGQVVYRKEFVMDSALVGRRVKLVAYGINERCTVRINDYEVGTHRGGYASFSREVAPGILKIGQPNRIEVAVDNRRSARRGSVPLRHQFLGARNEGGIYDDIFLLLLPEVYIDRVQAEVKWVSKYEACDVNVAVTFGPGNVAVAADSLAKLQCVAELWNPTTGQLVASSPAAPVTRMDERLSLNLTLKNPALWSPANPYLYELRTKLLRAGHGGAGVRRSGPGSPGWAGSVVLDVFKQAFGFRDFEVRDKRFFLNGQPWTFKGVSWLPESPEEGAAVGWLGLEKAIGRIAALGANAVRVVGRPAPAYLVDLCDQQGLLLLEEIPLHSFPAAALRDSTTRVITRDYLQEVIERDASHPSVVAWGLAVDYPSALDGLGAPLETLVAWTRQVDSSRPTYYTTRAVGGDRYAHLVDFVGLELFGLPEAAIAKVLSEVSASKRFVAFLGYPAAASGGLSPEAEQAHRLQQALQRLSAVPNLAGVFVTAAADWRSERPTLLAGSQASLDVYPIGLMDLQGRPRLAYHIAQSFFRRSGSTGSNSAMATVVGGLVPDSAHTVFVVTGLGFAFVFVFFFRRDRRLRGHLRRVFVHPHGFLVDLREARRLPPFLTMLVALTSAAALSIFLSGFGYAYRSYTLLDEGLSLLIPNDGVKARMVDLVWHPTWFIPVFIGLGLGIFFLHALAISVVGFFLGHRIALTQSWAFVVWTSANLLFFVPVAMVSYRLFVKGGYFPILTSLFAFFGGWSLWRVLRGLRVLYNLPFRRMLLLFLFGALVVLGSLAFVYQRHNGLLDYVGFYANLLQWQ